MLTQEVETRKITRTVCIVVTPEDITKATRLKHNDNDFLYIERCPVALAATRAFGQTVRVRSIDIWIGDKFISLPDVACQFIRNFDREFPGPIEPIEFCVEVENE